MDEISSDESDTIAPLLETYSLPGDRLQADFVRFEVDAVGTRNVFLVRGCDKPRLQRAAHEAMLKRESVSHAATRTQDKFNRRR